MLYILSGKAFITVTLFYVNNNYITCATYRLYLIYYNIVTFALTAFNAATVAFVASILSNT